MNNNPQTVVKEKSGARYLGAATVATVGAMALSTGAQAAEGAPGMDAAMITSAVDGVGLPALIGAAVAAMLAIAILIWGGKKIIGFFTK